MNVEMKEEGIREGSNRKERMMSENGLKERKKKRLKRKKERNNGENVDKNIMDKELNCERKDKKWGVDIS